MYWIKDGSDVENSSKNSWEERTAEHTYDVWYQHTTHHTISIRTAALHKQNQALLSSTQPRVSDPAPRSPLLLLRGRYSSPPQLTTVSFEVTVGSMVKLAVVFALLLAVLPSGDGQDTCAVFGEQTKARKKQLSKLFETIIIMHLHHHHQVDTCTTGMYVVRFRYQASRGTRW